jgi:hypothetical protein
MLPLQEWVGRTIVVDMRSPYVALGTLARFDDQHLLLTDADLHDLRDSPTGRENYVAESKMSGIKRNRKQVLIVAAEVVSVSRLSDIIDE